MTHNSEEHTAMTNTAKIVKKRGISPIWFLPILAAIIGIWMVINNIAHGKETITIHFASADSIIVDKTRIRYKGVIVGTVKKIQLDSEGGVNIVASIESQAKFMLRNKTKFWLVSPKANLTSISGLDTLFSGSYINISPGDGAEETHFTAILEQPIIVPDNALSLTLTSKNAGSISDGSPIFYKKIQVGEIVRVRLDQSGQFVKIKAFIDHKYSHLLKEESKFWNISGLTANISQAGIQVKLDSLTSLIAGGITFSSPAKSKKVKQGTKATYQLFDDIEQSEAGLDIELVLNNITNLPEGAGILFKGLGIGKITDIRYINDEKHFIASATINPQFSDMVTEDAQFWLEKTSLSFSKMKNLGNIITGDYIAFSPNEANTDSPAATHFVVQEAQKPTKQSVILTLITEDATGLSAGNPVSYQGIQIGHISALNFTADGRFIETSINVEKQYQYLVTKQSQFYLLSGVQVKGSLLNGIEVQSTPLENMMSGGIGLYNKYPVKQKNKALKDNVKFRLYPSKSLAQLGKNVFTAPKTIYITSKVLPSVSAGSPVYYHKFPIGEVTSFSIDKSGSMRTKLSIKGQYKHLINKQSVFWNVSGIK
ncbi:MAG: MCE family protein, partial [Psychromonas sp.]|nr:MCE family protein [Psychromonas sp.]